MKRTGFTLLETLIYSVLLSFIITGALVGVFQIIASAEKLSAESFIRQEGNFLLRKIDWALTGATNISIAGGNSLSMEKMISGAPANLTFESFNEKMRLIENGEPFDLSGNRLKISDLSFSFITSDCPASRPDCKVRAGFKVNGQPFELTRYLRR